MSTEYQDEDTARKGGLLESVKTLTSTLLTMGQTRLELLSNDIEEERAWLSSMMVWTLVALFCAALAVVLATLMIVVIFWDSYRLQALGAMVAVFTLASFFAWRVLCNMSSSKPRLFSASLAEFSKDREQLSHHRE
ncbi:MAG: hypothetical protein B7Y56_11280 [Gallionellales bacterium 35-53-114]|jgi:uncharacterized membrane protein YqjE|nr:MAG: hypothetical protein B7Y56_11280 [Gallionellales bacterium 35-53-114]OYZ64804.1 MAG: hypothetical protein B7Y04_03320 [Gallionellales bacterium 24-53-125]OZB07657.1 MAG: hypothetical protein B7X61_13695 [Gallionellales bacterium 39-52-133]HQS58650.1 phage holin family protein [Gallionellaceae bacterium]HQS74991.1 phage holin family protein [Gallionellaceae bacterium]